MTFVVKDIIATSDGCAIQAFNFTGETTSPMLESFDFDLDAGQLTMTFDEPVASSFVFDSFRIHEVNIVTSSASTYLQLLAVSINDTSGNPVEASFVNDSFVADNVNMFTWDATPAAIEKLVLDLNEGQPLITFDEIIPINKAHSSKFNCY